MALQYTEVAKKILIHILRDVIYVLPFNIELNYGECVVGRSRHHATGRTVKRDLYLSLVIGIY
jgi:hypothetical protein